uniref:Uncharacterized protein n=1 Tax=Fagus sylvatica TaxID=28930 RepID=A0A2N9EJT4_FAGSY
MAIKNRTLIFERFRDALMCIRVLASFIDVNELCRGGSGGGGGPVVGTIDDRAINTKRVLNPWKRNENHTLCLNSAKAIGCTVVNIGTQDFIEGRLDPNAKREVAVLYLEGGPIGKSSHLLNGMTTIQGKRKVLDSLKKSMQVDDGTAQYYLSISNGNPRVSLSEFSEDLKWERQAGMA